MHFRYVYLYILTLLFTVGCFKSPGEEATPSSTKLPVTPVYKTNDDSYLWAEGDCGGNTVVEITYKSEATSEKTVEAPCVSDHTSIKLPVSNGLQYQTFSITQVGKLKGKETRGMGMSLIYYPPAGAQQAFAVLVGGEYSETQDPGPIVTSTLMPTIGEMAAQSEGCDPLLGIPCAVGNKPQAAGFSYYATDMAGSQVVLKPGLRAIVDP